jgi:folate-binding protein YgfZ
MGKKETVSSQGAVAATPAYEAATGGAAALCQGHRRFLMVEGRSPGEMLKGILSGRIPLPLKEGVNGWSEGEAPYSTILTPRGRMVTDLRLLSLQGSGFLLDLPDSGLEGALLHFKKYLNPRFAQIVDRSRELGMLTLVGPKGPGLLSEVLGFEVQAPGEGELRFRPGGRGPELLLVGNSDVHPVALDLILPLEALEGVRGRLDESGVHPLDGASWEVLRIERGTPLFGVDMTEETIPVEAGIHKRAIDYQKGCYTGQEVIIRIRDRGKVNKSLQRILLGDAEVPSAGTDLYLPREVPPATAKATTDLPVEVGGEEEGPSSRIGGKSVGWVTSACRSPRFGQTVALGFVGRGAERVGEVRLGGPLGPPGRVEALGLE